MNNYDFSTLNDKEFEQIAKDLLNEKYKLELQDFKVGKDKGIDLRYSTSKNNNSIIVQVKHYIGSAFAQLKHTLQNKELDKVKLLKPDRYIIVTSLILSAIQKDELKEILEPYVLTSNDIFGQEDLNGFLLNFKEIEKKYFKLWFSSLNVFNSVLNNAIEGRTKYMLEKIRKKIPFYVITKKLDDANKILQKEKLLLITGQPGIGKTTLAEILLFDRGKNGCKIYKVENITEAESIISPNDDEKQLFYFDDFLGANYIEIINAHKTETQLTSFVERIKNTPNKYLILTTRTVILNHAIERYEKISLSKIGSHQFEIKLNDYNKIEKALILYNHLYFRNVKPELYDSILNEKFYRTIIQHKNYTPRIIEFITDNSKIEKLTPIAYHQFILNNLNNPKEIWRYSYNNQIQYLDRCLLLTLFTLENFSFETPLINAFEERLSYEKTEHNQIINANQFQDSVKIILNGFITSNLYPTNPPLRDYSFINPSLADFLIGHVCDSYPERKSIIASITYVEQLNIFNPEKAIISLEKELQTLIRDKIAKSKLQIFNSTEEKFTENNANAIFLEILCRYCFMVNTDNLLLDHFKKISFKESWSSILEKIEYFLINIGDAPQTIEYINENFIKIIEKMMYSISSYSNASKIPILFEKFKHNYEEYSESEDGYDKIIEVIESVLQSSESEIDKKESDINNFDELSELYDDVYTLEMDLKLELFPSTYIDHDFKIEINTSYWENKIEENCRRLNALEDSFEDYDKDYYTESRFESKSEEKEIDELFTKQE